MYLFMIYFINTIFLWDLLVVFTEIYKNYMSFFIVMTRMDYLSNKE